jgi:5,10-methylene-tetrahydrofolate dehydrogenase/methenyl tetrahydrofolate cyclohydrolase
MKAQIIDGKLLAEELRRQIAEDVQAMVSAGRPRPGLATVLIGENPASQVYVRAKQRACDQVGIGSFAFTLPTSASQKEVEQLIQELNADPRVNGILVQLPLPPGLDEEQVLNAVRIEKDVDGFHPLNIGRLARKGRDPLFLPNTPAAVLRMLDQSEVKLEGANAVVLGRSNLVGMPVALLLVRHNATVTICHSHSHDLPEIARQADVLIAAMGRPKVVKADWVKPGAVVIDVGVNRVEDPSQPRGYRLVGDVAFEQVKEVASALTPVPGGVGPMSTVMLLKNTVRAAKLA